VPEEGGAALRPAQVVDDDHQYDREAPEAVDRQVSLLGHVHSPFRSILAKALPYCKNYLAVFKILCYAFTID
jgi:hypothetical protein